jgi:hypothetical protein
MSFSVIVGLGDAESLNDAVLELLVGLLLGLVGEVDAAFEVLVVVLDRLLALGIIERALRRCDAIFLEMRFQRLLRRADAAVRILQYPAQALHVERGADLHIEVLDAERFLFRALAQDRVLHTHLADRYALVDQSLDRRVARLGAGLDRADRVFFGRLDRRLRAAIEVLLDIALLLQHQPAVILRRVVVDRAAEHRADIRAGRLGEFLNVLLLECLRGLQIAVRVVMELLAQDKVLPLRLGLAHRQRRELHRAVIGDRRVADDRGLRHHEVAVVVARHRLIAGLLGVELGDLVRFVRGLGQRVRHIAQRRGQFEQMRRDLSTRSSATRGVGSEGCDGARGGTRVDFHAGEISHYPLPALEPNALPMPPSTSVVAFMKPRVTAVSPRLCAASALYAP